ncbi:MAG: hypothetical protein WA824_00330 [Candidatus Sulfotelmatobacter sp.]
MKQNRNHSLTGNGPSNRFTFNLDKNLINYATAASAAGVSLLALAQPAQARVIFTPANLPITERGPVVQLDVNNDGVPDFSFYNSAASGAFAKRREGPNPQLGFYAHFLVVSPAQPGNEVGAITSFTGGECAAELDAGRKVGNGKNFQPNALDLFAVAGDYTSPGTLNCPWQHNKGGFLGLKFMVSGKTYYGWAHINLSGTSPTIDGYAYESAAGQTILTGATHGGSDDKADASQSPKLAPQPASLGLLANGAPGLAAWRRPDEMQ